MRQNCVRSILVQCIDCGRQAVVNLDTYPRHLADSPLKAACDVSAAASARSSGRTGTRFRRGIASRVIGFPSDEGVMVIEFLHGRPLSPDGLEIVRQQIRLRQHRGHRSGNPRHRRSETGLGCCRSYRRKTDARLEPETNASTSYD